MDSFKDIDINSFIDQIKNLFIAKKQYQSPNQGQIPVAPEATNKYLNINNSTKDIPQSGYQVPIKSQYHNSGGFDPSGKGTVGRVHQGVDLRASGGTAIYPIAVGIVSKVQLDPKGGNTVNIRHANGVTSYYAHMGSIAVHQGDTVDLNTVIGTVGDSGNAKGFPHLHFQTWKDGKLIDPASLVSMPTYTVFDAKKEKLWLPGAKALADSWNIKQHLDSKRKAVAERNDTLVALANKYYNLATK